MFGWAREKIRMWRNQDVFIAPANTCECVDYGAYGGNPKTIWRRFRVSGSGVFKLPRRGDCHPSFARWIAGDPVLRPDGTWLVTYKPIYPAFNRWISKQRWAAYPVN